MRAMAAGCAIALGMVTLSAVVEIPGLAARRAFADTGGAAYQTKVLADGADAYYPFDNASSSGGTFSGAGPHAPTMTESAGWSAGPELLTGPQVSGASSVTPGSSGGTIAACCSYTNSFSWSGWVELPGGQGAPSSAGLVDTGYSRNEGFLVDYNSGQFRFTTISGINSSQIVANYVIPSGVPLMVAVTYDRTTLTGTIYVNGASIQSGTMQSAAASTGTVYVGSSQSNASGSHPWPGYEDSVSFFPSALLGSTISAQYAIGAPQTPTATPYQTQVLADGADSYIPFDNAASSGGLFPAAGPKAQPAGESPSWAAGPELLTNPISGASSVVAGSSGASTACCSYTTPFTWSGWIEVPTAQSPPGFGGLVDTGNYAGNGFTVNWNNGTLQFVTIQGTCGGCYTQLQLPFVIPTGVPLMVAVTFDGSIGSIYVNGNLLGSGLMQAPAAATSPMLIGAYHNGFNGYDRWTGYEDSVAFFPTALSRDKIAAEYAIGSPPPPAASTYQSQVLNYDHADAYYSFDNAGASGGQLPGAGPRGQWLVESSGWATQPELLTLHPPVSGGSSVKPGASGGATSCCTYAGSFSWSGWIEVPAGQSLPSFAGLVDTGNSAGGGFDVNWNNGTLQFVTLQGTCGSCYTQVQATYSFPIGTPVMVAVTFNAATGVGTIYVNGVSIGSNSQMQAPVFSSAPILIGAYNSPVNGYAPWPWYEDSVTFWNGAIQAATVVQDYAVGRGAPVGPTPSAAIDNKESLGSGPCSGKPIHQLRVAPVDTASGNFTHSFDDLTVPGRGLPLHFTHTYNSLVAGTDGPLGFGWTHDYNMSLNLSQAPSTVVVIQENGCQSTFTQAGSAYQAPPRVFAGLVHNGDGTWTFTREAKEIFTFNAAGQLTAEKDLNGYVTALAYNGSGQLATITDPAGRTLALAYTGTHLTSLTDTASPARVVRFAYNDGAGNLTDVTDAGGGVTHFTYDPSHWLLTMLDPNQAGSQNPVPLTNHYDASGRVDWQKDFMGRQTSFDYTSIAGATKVTDPNGFVTLDTYAFGELVSQTSGYGTPQAATWTYTYDQLTAGQATVTDPDNHTTTKTYDPAGNLLSSTDALNRTTTYTYDALNDQTSVTDPNQVTTTMTYDAKGNLQSKSTPLVGSSPPQSETTTYTYGDPSHPGDVTSITDANTKVWPSSYDSYGNLSSTTDPLGDKTQYCYDGVGRKTAEIAPKGFASGVTCASASPAPYTTYFTTNAFGDPLNTTDPLGHLTKKTYDADRNLKTLTDPDNNQTINSYDLDNELTTVTRADQSALTYGYDADGNQTSQRDGSNNPTTYAFANPALPHAVTSVTDPNNRTTSYGYDGAGNRLTKQDPGGNCSSTPKTGCTTFGYDPANQLTSITYSDGTTPNVSNVIYDGDGQRTAMTDGTGTSHWVWDSLHRLTSSTDGASKTVGYGYDLKGQLTSITYPGTTGTVTRGYDDAGRLHTVSDWLSHLTTFNYDADSNQTSDVYPNGTTATYTPDGADRLMAVSHAPTANPNAPFASFSYGRDNADQLTSVTSTGVPADNHTWGYTALNQLKTDSAATFPYAYDKADNLNQLAPTATSQAFDPANQLTASSSILRVGTGSGGDSGTTQSFVVTLPAGIVANDQILLAATLPQGKSVTTPSGYTLVGNYTSGTQSTSAKVAVFRKTAAGGEANVTVAFNAKFAKTVTAAVYRGVDPTTPIDVTPTSGSAAPGTSVTAPSVTTTKAGAEFLMIQGAENAGAAGTWTAPSAMAQQVQQAGGTSVAGAMADQLGGPAGASGTRQASFSQSAQLVGVLLPLRPVSSTAFGYDSRGNRTSKTPSGGSATSLAYDQANRLKAYGATATYAYNGDGLRASKTVSGSSSAFVWDQAEGLPLVLSDGTNNYVYGPGGMPLEQIAGSTVYYFHHDQLGSTRALTNSAGSVVATQSYDAYGRVSGSTGTVTTPLSYAGQYGDAESGLVYMRARYYDAGTGQFLNRDPIVAVTQAAYGYVDNAPLNGTDPRGLSSVHIPGTSNCWHVPGTGSDNCRNAGLRHPCYSGPGGSSDCQSLADQHPAVKDALIGVAAGGLTVGTGGAAIAAYGPLTGSGLVLAGGPLGFTVAGGIYEAYEVGREAVAHDCTGPSGVGRGIIDTVNKLNDPQLATPNASHIQTPTGPEGPVDLGGP